MVSTVSLTVRPVTEKDRQQLANLIHFETRVHRHLDWRAPLDWIGYSPNLVAENHTHIVAALVCPPDPPEVAWVRLFAASAEYPLREVWHALWSEAKAELGGVTGIRAGAIPLQNWFRTLLEESSFQLAHNIVLLTWQRGAPTPAKRPFYGRLRPMNLDDIPAVAEVDQAAFGPLWRNSAGSLSLAYRQAAVATVVEDPSGIIGYQISTASPMGGHLARLAVQTQHQGKGIGLALVQDTLEQFERRGALRVTVNTQEDNQVSLSLYEKLGFHLTGEKYPVLEYQF